MTTQTETIKQWMDSEGYVDIRCHAINSSSSISDLRRSSQAAIDAYKNGHVMDYYDPAFPKGE